MPGTNRRTKRTANRRRPERKLEPPTRVWAAGWEVHGTTVLRCEFPPPIVRTRMGDIDGIAAGKPPRRNHAEVSARAQAGTTRLGPGALPPILRCTHDSQA
eukprot:2864051-Rhodomonas_salina.1